MVANSHHPYSASTRLILLSRFSGRPQRVVYLISAWRNEAGTVHRFRFLNFGLDFLPSLRFAIVFHDGLRGVMLVVLYAPECVAGTQA